MALQVIATVKREPNGRTSRKAKRDALKPSAPEYSPGVIRRIMEMVSSSDYGNVVTRLMLESKLLPCHAEAAGKWNRLVDEWRKNHGWQAQTVRAQDISRVPGMSTAGDDESDEAQRKRKRINNRYERCERLLNSRGAKPREAVRRIVEMDEYPVGWDDVLNLRAGLDAIVEALGVDRNAEKITRH